MISNLSNAKKNYYSCTSVAWKKYINMRGGEGGFHLVVVVVFSPRDIENHQLGQVISFHVQIVDHFFFSCE
jgi:hypothetical protein